MSRVEGDQYDDRVTTPTPEPRATEVPDTEPQRTSRAHPSLDDNSGEGSVFSVDTQDSREPGSGRLTLDTQPDGPAPRWSSSEYEPLSLVEPLTVRTPAPFEPSSEGRAAAEARDHAPERVDIDPTTPRLGPARLPESNDALPRAEARTIASSDGARGQAASELSSTAASGDAGFELEFTDFAHEGGERALPRVPARPAQISTSNASAEEEVPISGTPSIDALVQATRAVRGEKDAEPRVSSSVLGAAMYDRRPPDIHVDSTSPSPLQQTPLPLGPSTLSDAPVARTKPPEAPPNRLARSAAVAVLLLGGLGLFFGVRALQDTTEPPDQARIGEPAPIADPAPAAAAAVVVEPTPPTAAPALVPSEPAGTESAPSPVANTAPGVRPNARRVQAGSGVAASLSRPSAESASTADVSVQETPEGGAFNSNAAGLALTAAASRASSCRKPGDPSGIATVTITFASNGRVTTANVSGPPFAGTETGGCIASIMRDARVPAFDGTFTTVKKTVVVQ